MGGDFPHCFTSVFRAVAASRRRAALGYYHIYDPIKSISFLPDIVNLLREAPGCRPPRNPPGLRSPEIASKSDLRCQIKEEIITTHVDTCGKLSVLTCKLIPISIGVCFSDLTQFVAPAWRALSAFLTSSAALTASSSVAKQLPTIHRLSSVEAPLQTSLITVVEAPTSQ